MSHALRADEVKLTRRKLSTISDAAVALHALTTQTTKDRREDHDEGTLTDSPNGASRGRATREIENTRGIYFIRPFVFSISRVARERRLGRRFWRVLLSEEFSPVLRSPV
jgi:hypothetical protein